MRGDTRKLFVEEDFRDEEIKNRLLHTLSWSNHVDSPNLNIEVSEGIATLEGIVDSLWKKIMCEELAMGVTGVKHVINHMVVVPSRVEPDEQIANNIKNNIDKNFLVDVDKVHISVNKGIVRLSGSVGTPLAVRAALNSAIYTPGVTDVDNHLRIMAG